MLRSHTLGISATQLCNTLREQHSDAWMRRAIQYLGVCEQFLALGTTRGQIAPPPQMPPVPSPVWLLTVYGYDVLMRLDEFKARITSTFGSILKMDSTKKVTEKLAGAASGTAAWATNVGNEHGQVLMSVLTCCEGSEGLSKMAAGLMRRYRLAEVPAPQLIYVDLPPSSSTWTCPPAHLRGPRLLQTGRRVQDGCLISGTSASAKYFQAFLIEGLVRWNEDRAAAAEGHEAPLLSYSGHLRHAPNQKSQRVLGHQMVKPAAYTGELIEVEYLFQQTGRVLEDVSVDPDARDKAAAVINLDEVDEGIQEDVGDFVAAFVLDQHFRSSPVRGSSCRTRAEPAHPAAPPDVPGSQTPVENHSSDSEEEIQGPDGQPGYQHVLKLAQPLVELRSLQGLSDSRVDRL